MKLSTKARYGLRAVIEIARQFGGAPSKRKDVAVAQDISDSYLENILIVLKNSKIIETTRGANGGYVLCRHPSEITVLEVVDALEGPLNLVECVDSPESCKKSDSCCTRDIWKMMSESWKSTLDKISLQDVIEKGNEKKCLNYCI
jgi:Rrf2 family cysteine metabolism transcriptional repressor